MTVHDSKIRKKGGGVNRRLFHLCVSIHRYTYTLNMCYIYVY